MLRSLSLLLLILLLCLSGCQRSAEMILSPFNGLPIDPATQGADYNFVVLGHIRANHGERSPNAVLREHVGKLVETNPAFVMNLGDLYYHIDGNSMNSIAQWISDHIKVPFFNAVGNHDTMRGGYTDADGLKVAGSHDIADYQNRFGPLYYSFKLGSEAFIVLDLARDFGMSRKQREFLVATVADVTADTTVKNVFVFSHMVFWSYHNRDMVPLFRYRHPVHPPSDTSLFQDVVRPILKPLTMDRQVFLMAGDIGGGGSYLQTFFHQDDEFTYVATGMGRTARDGFVVVHVDEGRVDLRLRHFQPGSSDSLPSHDNGHWERFYQRHPDHAARVDRYPSAPAPG